nr:response regulator [Rhodohalobacter sp. 614A]
MNLRIDTLRKKIGLGFGLLTIVLAIAVFITIYLIQDINNISDFIRDQRYSSARAGLELSDGINESMADLRGWTILQRDSFKVDREETWENEIRPNINRLQEISEDWTNPENVERLAELAPLISRLEQLQNEVEALATTDLEQATNILDGELFALNEQIERVLEALVENHERLLQQDFATIDQEITLLNNIAWLLLAAGVLIGFVLAVIITNSITAPLSKAVEVAKNIGDGDLTTSVPVTGSGEMRKLGEALVNMRNSLKKTQEENQLYDWFTRGQNKLNNVTRGDQGIEELANKIIKFLTTYVVASIGALYLFNDDKEQLELIGKYAFSTAGEKNSFKFGEGLIGQAASNKQTITLTEIDENYIRIKSSITEAPPKNILAIPFIIDNKPLGVVEIGKFESFAQKEIEFLESSMEDVGISMYSAIARKKIQELLEETQLQSEELQQQQEELEQNNEELEEQAHSLKEQQEELRVANEELEEQTQVVEQKNHDLERARTEIELKAEQLEISSKYKSEFLANMSHELRTPLNSLLILAGDLKRNKNGNLSEDELENAEVIEKSGRDLLELINEILDLSKIESGKMELNVSEVNINELANDLSRNFKKQAEKKGLNLITNIHEKVPEAVYTDRQRLEQILKNLLSNALKFTANGEIKIDFTRNADEFISIAVTDTGIGIPQEKQDLIFEAFQQADGGTSRKYGGTGLGLSISRELAKLLSGKMTLESSEGKGATFTVTIPLTLKSDGNKTSEKTAKVTVKSNNITVRNTRFVDFPTIDDNREDISESDDTILIIEDDANFAKILGKQATERGFKFISAATGEDGLILANQYQPTAIILDLNLPGIDGHMVLRELKGNPDVRHIPVHIISAEEKSLDSIKSGAVQYLTKPVTEDQLQGAFGRIEDFINRKMKNLLVIEDNDTMRKSIVKLIGNGDVKCFEAGTAEEAFQQLEKNRIDCIVLDIGLPDISGFDLIQKLEEDYQEKLPPIIVYTGKELTKEEVDKLQQYAETIIVKGIKSEERLLDETALFLHRTVKNLPQNKQDIITSLYDKESVFRDKKVLLVDDDMRNVFALSKVLKEKGLEIDKAENGRVALKKLDEGVVDLVLMDIMMPEMDGYECMRQIRKQSKFRDLPIIALTAKAMKTDRQKCLDAGADDYITKPVDLERLLSLMRIWIKK